MSTLTHNSMTNHHAPGLLALERQVENGVLDVFREMDTLGGVIAAIMMDSPGSRDRTLWGRPEVK